MRRAAVPVLILLLASTVPFVSPLLKEEVFTFRDHSDYFIPLRYFTATHLRAGELPLWNPYNGSGERWLANPQAGVFYPPTWIFLLVPFSTAYLLFLWLHLAILGVGAFLLFSRWCSAASALVAAIALMFCGPTLSLLDVSNNLATFAWIPATLAAASERAGPRSRVPRSVCVLLIALLFLGGEPFLAITGAFLYAIVYLTSSKKGIPERAAELALVAVAAVLVSAVQLVPFLESLSGSDRARGGGTPALRESMAPLDWLATLIPPAAIPLPTSQQFIPSVYLGSFLVFAAAVAATRGRKLQRPRPAAGWLTLLLVTVLLAAGRWLPPVAWLWTRSGLDVSRYPARLIPLGALAVTALAALGLDAFPDLSKRWRMVAFAILLLAILFAVLMFSAPMSEKLFIIPIWLVVLAVLLFARVSAAVSVAVVLALLIADFTTVARPMLRSQRFDRNLQPYRSIMEPQWKLLRLFEHGRSPLGETERRAWLSGYLNLLIARFDASTPAPVVHDRYLKVHDLALTKPRFDLVDFLSVGYLATSRDIHHPAYRPIARNGPVTLFLNTEVRPVAQLWTSMKMWSSVEEAFRAALEGQNAGRVVQISCRPGEDCQSVRAWEAQSAVDAPTRSRSGASTTFVGLNRVTVEVATSTPAVLSLSQLDAPGWQVELDGAKAEPLRAYGIFRAVAVPAGRHHIRWSYEPASLRIGAVISTIALVVLIGEVLSFCRRRRREASF